MIGKAKFRMSGEEMQKFPQNISPVQSGTARNMLGRVDSQSFTKCFFFRKNCIAGFLPLVIPKCHKT